MSHVLSKHAAHAPKHRAQPAPSPVVAVPKKAVRTTIVLCGLAAAGTSAAVAGGIVLDSPTVAAAADLKPVAQAPASTRAPELSRSQDRREATDPAKVSALAADAQVAAYTQTENIGGGDPKSIASALLSSYGWSGSQFGCLESLWNRESGWNVHAANPSGAYGIPQSLPGSKMASAGSDWQDSAETQIRWGLGYIAQRYGSPCGAWGHSESNGWY